jgi:hypothetical protein
VYFVTKQAPARKSTTVASLPSISNDMVKQLISSFPQFVPQCDDYAFNPSTSRITVFIEPSGVKEEKKQVQSQVNKQVKVNDLSSIISGYSSDVPKYAVVVEYIGSEDSDSAEDYEYLNNLRVVVFGSGIKTEFINRDKMAIVEAGDNTTRVRIMKKTGNESSGGPQVSNKATSVFIRDIGEVEFKRTKEWFISKGVEMEALKKKIPKYTLSRALVKDYKKNMMLNLQEMQQYFTDEFKGLKPVQLVQLDDYYVGNPNVMCDCYSEEGTNCKCDRHPPYNPTYHLIAGAIVAGSKEVFDTQEGKTIMKSSNAHWDYWPFQIQY